MTSCSRGCLWQQTAAVERPTSDKGTGKRKLTKGKKEGAEGVMAKGKLRGNGDREQEETLMSQEEYVMNRRRFSASTVSRRNTENVIATSSCNYRTEAT